MRTYPGLDSIRAIAAVSVLATHTAFFSSFYTTGGFLGAVSSRLDIGVAIFFVLSGFLLSLPFLSRISIGSRELRIGRYFFKRALRILPVYWLAVVSAFLLLPANEGATTSEWLRNLTLTQIYFSDVQSWGLTQMWSLATEVAFYISLPLLVLYLSMRSRKHGWSANLVFAILVPLVAVNIFWSYFLSASSTRAGWWLPAYISWFSAGILLAVLRIEADRGVYRIRFLHQLANQPGVSWIIGLSLFAIAATPLAGPIALTFPSGSQAVVKNLLYAVVSLLIVLPTVLANDFSTRYHRVIQHRTFRHIGHISYGVFALHMIVLDFVTPILGFELFRGNGIQVFLIVLGISLVLAEITYRLIELPLMRLKDWSPFRAVPTTKPTQSELIQ